MTRTVSGRWTIAIAPVVFLLSGCVALETNPLAADGPPPPGSPCQLVTTWQPQVFFTPDPTRGGAEMPTLAGRVYLFGEEIKYPMTGDGAMVVDLFDGAVPPGAAPVLLEEWRFDPATLRRLLRHDPIGWGYTLPLVWGTYRPDITRVQLKARYEPPHGTPLYSESASMAIDNPGTTMDGAPVTSQSAKPAVTAGR